MIDVVQLSSQLSASKEESSVLKQSLSQTTSALEDSEKHVDKLTSDLTAAKQHAVNITARVGKPRGAVP